MPVRLDKQRENDFFLFMQIFEEPQNCCDDALSCIAAKCSLLSVDVINVTHNFRQCNLPVENVVLWQSHGIGDLCLVFTSTADLH